MRMNLRVEFLDGTSKNVTAVASDMVAFENEFNLSIARLENELKLTHLIFLAWNVEHRNKATAKPFLEWVDDVESVGVGDPDPKLKA
jgi:hypothetical protein